MTERDDINNMMKCIHNKAKNNYERKLKMRKNVIEDKIKTIGREIFDEISNKLNNLADNIENGNFDAAKRDEILNSLEAYINIYRNNITNTNIKNIDNIGNEDMTEISNFFVENIFENYVNSLNFSENKDFSLVQILEFQLYILNDLKTECQKKRNYYDCRDRNVGDKFYAWTVGFIEAIIWGNYSNIACQYDLFITNTLSIYENKIKLARKNLIISLEQLESIRNVVSNLGDNNKVNAKKLDSFKRYRGHYGHLMGIQG